MTDYDSMSVKELLDDYIGWSAGDTQEQEDMLVEIESALRKAVIREASVGTATFATSSMPRLLWSTVGTKEGQFYLIPKETP